MHHNFGRNAVVWLQRRRRSAFLSDQSAYDHSVRVDLVSGFRADSRLARSLVNQGVAAGSSDGIEPLEGDLEWFAAVDRFGATRLVWVDVTETRRMWTF